MSYAGLGLVCVCPHILVRGYPSQHPTFGLLYEPSTSARSCACYIPANLRCYGLTGDLPQ
jgi:hypothetical protein